MGVGRLEMGGGPEVSDQQSDVREGVRVEGVRQRSEVSNQRSAEGPERSRRDAGPERSRRDAGPERSRREVSEGMSVERRGLSVQVLVDSGKS